MIHRELEPCNEKPAVSPDRGKQLQSGWNFARVRRFAEQPWNSSLVLVEKQAWQK
jgi:hypothetical protein